MHPAKRNGPPVRFVPPRAVRPIDWPPGPSDKWSPAVDIVRGRQGGIVRAELPGIDPKDLDVTVRRQPDRPERREEGIERDEGERVYQSETRYGSFRRTVPLPEGVDTENVDAQYANGVLTLRLPKTAPAAGKRIEVR